MAARPFLLPWPVAEAVVLQVARNEARSVAVEGDLSGRIARQLDVPVATEGLVDMLVFVGDGLTPSLLARTQALQLAERGRGELILCEPSFPATGLGREMLRRIDPVVAMYTCDELPDALGGTRQRKPWEAPVTWLLAEVAAWRFRVGAEDLRAGFRARLPRMRVEQMLMSCRRILQRFDNAYEPFALAAEELGRRGEREGVRRLLAELDLSPEAPSSARGRLRHALVACSPPGDLADTA
jgi:hypothetical protein